MTIINDAYIGTHLKLEKDLGVEPHSIFPGLRFDDERQLIRELPDESRLAIMFDEVQEQVEEEIGCNTADEDTSKVPPFSKTQNGTNADAVQHSNGKHHESATYSAGHAASSSSEQRKKNAKTKKVVAVASIKPWKCPVMRKHYLSLQSSGSSLPEGPQYPPSSMLDDTSRDADPSQYRDWEIATCASVNDARYRGMGIVSKLTGLLIDELRTKVEEAGAGTEVAAQTSAATASGNSEKNQKEHENTLPIRLWTSALGGSYNVQYWQKRGFTIQGDGPDTAPPGVWGNARDIQIWTLNKVLD